MVADESAMDINMEKLMKLHNQKTPESKKILELNANHPMIIKISESLTKIDHKKISNLLSEKFPDRFIPRYNMVSFTSIPYSEVYRRGNIQKEIISKLNLENLDMSIVKSMINNKLSPLV